METKPTIELRLNNTIFKCVLEGKYYNLADTKAYAIGVAMGLIPQEKQMLINLDAQVICENCWKANKDNQEGLNLQEPSKIVPAGADALKGLRKPMN